MATHVDTKWYWLDAAGIAWVRANIPDARIERHAVLAFYFGRGWNERRDADAVAFGRGGLGKARRAGLKPREANVETHCDFCQQRYVPHYQHDPCISDLPGVRFACCGHGTGEGYVSFENGTVIRFAGSECIRRRPEVHGGEVKPDDERFWKIVDNNS